ncbi:hypothetical protein PR003_g23215 [Phytophthora rubi]|uniref:Reverse transcriptase domain-containing protein n=1 Tax=Phytophthora rubi TaxID=129364 RepID=A0A6A4CXZ4_9STRA|nr:hypothetical protein PR003_g23215 [Phytophthora rubi]
MATTQVDKAGLQSDHQGVILHLRSPSNPIRLHKEKRVFPVPNYARARADDTVLGELKALSDRLESGFTTALQAAKLWDQTKRRVAVGLLNAVRAAKKSKKKTYRKKIKRMYRRLDRTKELARAASQQANQDLQQRCHAKLVRLTQRIATTKREWIRAKSQRLFRSHTWREGKTTKTFFKRISCMFGDNIIPALRHHSGIAVTDPEAKADTLADAWSPIMRGVPASSSAVERVTRWMEQDTGDDTAMLADAGMITETAVRMALRECKMDKACGPDKLGNDWYRAYEDALVPILTRLYKLWYTEQVFPDSFLEANIFCLKKSGDGGDPLNYRPLALLNTDYKILTRLLTTQVRTTLARRISIFQQGFVPGRQIHATIDYFAAAQRMALCSDDARDALALLLDFAKAYDSLDRQFLYAVLRRHGYPRHFVQVIEKLHTGTNVRFLANGTRSRTVMVTRGIRQGCPLAPLLFILALEPLYRRLEKGAVHQGITLKTCTATAALRVAGYADDTAIYLRSPAELEVALATITDFGAASGLHLNCSKTVAIALYTDGLRSSTLWTGPVRLLPRDE